MPFKDTYLECMLAIVRDVVVKKKNSLCGSGYGSYWLCKLQIMTQHFSSDFPNTPVRFSNM